MRRALLTLALALPLLAACQLPLPGRDRPAAEANPITGGTITTTALDAAPVADPQAPPATPAAGAQAAALAPALPGDPATAPARAAETAAETVTETAPDAPLPHPEPAKSASQIACEEDGGTWARAGEGGGMSCIRPTRDSGKQCDRKTDCQGECLARSRTCAPIQPLFGCNAVLMDNGAEVSLCID